MDLQKSPQEELSQLVAERTLWCRQYLHALSKQVVQGCLEGDGGLAGFRKDIGIAGGYVLANHVNLVSRRRSQSPCKKDCTNGVTPWLVKWVSKVETDPRVVSLTT